MNAKKYKVMITFVEELENTESEESDIRIFGTNHASLAFWDDPKEDIYQDYLTVPYKWLPEPLFLFLSRRRVWIPTH